MAEDSARGHFGAQIQGMLYVLLHATVRRTFIGATIRGWLVNLPLLVALFLVLLGQPIAWSIAIVVVALILRLLYWRADRNGYVRFEVEQVQQPGGSATDIVDNQKVVTRATGKFSVKDWQEYVLAQPAEYWRVPMGDHAIMVRNGSGRFLYQFIRRGAIEAIEAGLLYHGRRPHEALAITYLTSWGPESEDPNFMFYAPSDEGDPARKQLKLYLAFEDKGTRDSVWHSLLGDGQQL